METKILEECLSFDELMMDILDAQDQQFILSAGSLRPGGKVDLNELGDTVWLEQFRFTREEVHQLVDALDLPEFIRCPQSRNREDRITATCMLLCRLAYPSCFVDVEMQFGWEKSRFSRITGLTALAIWNRWKHLLKFDPNCLTKEKLMEFAQVIHEKGAPLNVVAALIDGTLQKNARPIQNQKLLFNGWKRIHCLKYHAVLSPDGLVIHVYGPMDGRRHDETVFKESGLAKILDKYFWTTDGQPLFIYGDLAYMVGPHILSPFKGPVISEEQQRFNHQMSRVREPVEWIFKEVTQQFPFLDFSRSQKVLLTLCALFYMVALLFCNAHTILHYPQIPQYFACKPPTLTEYFTGEAIEDSELDKWCHDSPWVPVDIELTGEENEEG